MPLLRRNFFSFCLAALSFCLFACDLHFGALPTAQPTSTQPPTPVLTVVWALGGDLFAWREDDPTARKIATGAVVQPYLAPDGKHVTFTRGQQGDAGSLWSVGIDGVGEAQLVAPDVLKSIRDGHPQIDQVRWLDPQTVYFNTLQQYSSGSVRDDDLYRVQLGGAPQLILPPGAGGDFAFSPDGTQIAVVRPGEYDTQKGQVLLLDPLGVQVQEKFSFTALRAPSEVPFYPPLTWSADSTFVSVPIAERDDDRVALWSVPLDAQAKPQIFGYLSADPAGLPVWSGESMIYLRAGTQPAILDLILADADGQNPQVYASGDISNLRWLPDGDAFAYDQSGTWIGRENSPQKELENLPRTSLVFVAGHGYVDFAAGELRYAHLDQSGSTLIQSLSAAPVFDAVDAP